MKQVSSSKDEMIKDTSSQKLFHTEELHQSKIIENRKSNISTGGSQKRKNEFETTEYSDNITGDDEFYDEEDKESEPEDEQDHEQEDEEDEKHEEDHEEYDEYDDDSTVNDDIDNISDPKDSCSLQMMTPKVITNKTHRTIPQEFMHSNTSFAEQVSLESDLTNSISKNRKYLMSDDDLRRIIEDQHNQIEQLKSRLDGTKKLELNPIQEGHVRKIVKIELWKRIQFIRHTHVLDGYETDGTIGKFVMDRLSIDKNCREGFWECYKHVVRKTLKQHRNVVHSALRKKFISKSKFIL